MKVSRTSLVSAYPVALLGIASFSIMDMVIKGLTLEIGTFATLWWRSLIGVALAGAMFLWFRNAWPSRAALRIHLVRGIATTLMAVLFFWGLARVPMAQAVALTFIAPLLSLLLAGMILKERIGARIVGGSLIAFAGVVVILAGQARADLGPEALRGSAAILCSAMIYAWNIILMRQQAQVAGPLEIAFFQSAIVSCCFLAGAPFLAVLPPVSDWHAVLGAAALAFASLMLLSWAYARAEAQYLAPVEYTALGWAVLFGITVFHEPVRPLTLVGATMIIAACLYAARRRPAQPADVEAAI